MENNSHLRINGLGTSSGGDYNSVQINGKGDINGDLRCAELQINGLGCINGNVDATNARVAGKSKIKGNLKGKEITIDGMTEIGGTLSADNIVNRGVLRVSKDCGSEVFRSRGGFEIGGLLNAGRIDIELYADSRAREIGGEEIDIRLGDAFGFKKILDAILPGFHLNRILSTETIEGDNIYLENTSAKFVRGTNVNIGPGCHIERVEYKNSYHSAGNAAVKENNKI